MSSVNSYSVEGDSPTRCTAWNSAQSGDVKRVCPPTVGRMASGFSWSIICLMRKRTASAEWASPPRAVGIEVEKKYFSSKTPRGVMMYLFEVTRDTVDSCMPMASAMARRFKGRKYSTPLVRKAS